LARIWAEDLYASMRHELLQLMMRFQLCHQLPESDAYMAPQLLSPAQPDYRWEETGSFVLRYEYPFLPKGLIDRSLA
jgi:internalin A